MNKIATFFLILATGLTAFSQPNAIDCPYSVPLTSPMWEAENRLEIPEIQFVVPITECEICDAQAICNDENMAAYFLSENSMCIADHKTQGFSAIKYCETGMVCRLIVGDSVKKYRCIIFDSEGHNTGPSILLSDGTDAGAEGYDLMMYTCNDCWQNITVVVWEHEKQGPVISKTRRDLKW